jgi:MerR, DNA binding
LRATRERRVDCHQVAEFDEIFSQKASRTGSFDITRTQGAFTLTATVFRYEVHDPAVVDRATREGMGSDRADIPLTPRHSAGLVGMWENEKRGRIGVEAYFTGVQRLEDNPYRTQSEPYVLFGGLVEQRFGRVRLFANAENLGGILQTRFDPRAPSRRTDRRMAAARRCRRQNEWYRAIPGMDHRSPAPPESAWCRHDGSPTWRRRSQTASGRFRRSKKCAVERPPASTPPRRPSRHRRCRSAAANVLDLKRVLTMRDRGGVPCQSVRELVGRRLESLDRRIEELLALRDELRVVLRDWDKRLNTTAPGQRAHLLETLGSTVAIERTRRGRDGLGPLNRR